MLKNANGSYGSLSKFFHWFLAIMIIALISVGYLLEYIGNPSLYQVHKTMGFLFLLLAILRLSWRLYNINPGYEGLNLPKWMISAGTLVHYSLYLLMIIVPLSAFIASNAAQRPVSFLFLFDIPLLFEQKNLELAKTAMAVHRSGVFILCLVIVMHIGAALYHHFINKDFILNRMLPFNIKLSNENKLVRMLLSKVMKD